MIVRLILSRYMTPTGVILVYVEIYTGEYNINIIRVPRNLLALNKQQSKEEKDIIKSYTRLEIQGHSFIH